MKLYENNKIKEIGGTYSIFETIEEKWKVHTRKEECG